MKNKKLTSILGIVGAALFAFSICACISSQESEMQQATPYQAPMEPPSSFSFYGIGELRSFVSSVQSAVKLSDEEFESYAKTNSMLCSNDIDSKADLNNLVDELNRIPFPKLDKAKLIYMDYRPYFDDSHISIDIGNDRSCSFTFSLDRGLDSEIEMLKREISSLSSVDATRSAYINKLYVVDDISEWFKNPEAQHNAHVFLADIDGISVRITTRELSRAEAENAICAFEFGKLIDIIGE